MKKSQINYSFESILDEDLPYSIVVKNITAEETMDMFKALAMHFFVLFYLYYIFNLEYPKKFEGTLLTNLEAATGCVLRKYIFLETSP